MPDDPVLQDRRDERLSRGAEEEPEDGGAALKSPDRPTHEDLQLPGDL